MNTTTETFLNTFVDAYLVTARWSSGEDDPGDLDKYEWSEQAREQAKKDCQGFIDKVKAAFDNETADAILNKECEGLLAPHDFWLTRVGHGAGFWDGDWEDLDEDGKKLTEISKTFNEHTYVYKGDDDLLYFG
jgi:hypothetical protein